MEMFSWKAEYSVGLPVIDTQHKKLFRMADDLHKAMTAGKGNALLTKLLSDLVAYTCEHFDAEEGMMWRSGFPGYAAHHKEHEDLKRQVFEFQDQMKAGKVLLTIDLLTFLQTWLSHHIKGSDQKVAAHVRAVQVH